MRTDNAGAGGKLFGVAPKNGSTFTALPQPDQGVHNPDNDATCTTNTATVRLHHVDLNTKDKMFV